MADYVGHGEPLAGNELEHASQKVSELLGEATGAVARVGTPEDISTVAGKEFVETILWHRLAEWRMSSHHNEKDDSNGKKID